MKLSITLFAAFCVYCGHAFTKRQYEKKIISLSEGLQERVDSSNAKHASLLELHREHIDKCRFEFPKKLTK